MFDQVLKAPLTMVKPRSSLLKMFQKIALNILVMIHQRICLEFKRNYLPDNIIMTVSVSFKVFQDNCPEDNCSRGKLPPGQLLPRKIAPRTIALRIIDPRENYPPRTLPPHHKISPENNCPHSSKFPSKSTTSELRKTMACLRVP